MHLWGRTFHRIPPERREYQYGENRSDKELRNDVSKAFDQLYVQRWVIRFLFLAVSVEFGAVKWLASHLWDCIQAAHQVQAVLR